MVFVSICMRLTLQLIQFKTCEFPQQACLNVYKVYSLCHNTQQSPYMSKKLCYPTAALTIHDILL